MVTRKSFNGKFTAKIDFPIGYFILPLLVLTLEVCSLSIHSLVSIWTTCMLVEFEQNRMVQTTELFDKNWLTNFDNVLMPFWKTLL